MTKAKFNQLAETINTYCGVRYSGVRDKKKASAEMLAKDVHSLSWQRKKNSKYIVFYEKENLGTSKYPDVYCSVNTAPLDSCRETEKLFIWGHQHINKESVIGYLSA